MGWNKDHGTAAKVNAEYAKEQGNVAKQEATNLSQLKTDVEAATQNASTAADNANAIIKDANIAASNADDAASEAFTQANHAKNEGNRAKAEADRLAGTDVSVLDNKIGSLSSLTTTNKTSVVASVNEVTTQLAQIDATSIKNTPMPSKIGTQINSPKLVIVGATNDKLNVLQYNGKHYVLYELDAAPGTTDVSVGVNWGLIRLKKALMAHDAYVAKTAYENIVGTVDTLYAPAHRNALETMITFPHTDEATELFISATSNGYGVGCYGLVGANAVSSVDFKIKVGTSKKGNILILGTTGSSQSVDILVSGEIVKTFNPTKVVAGTTPAYKLIEFDIPSRLDSSAEVTVTLRNNDTANKKVYFSCVNFYALKDYSGQDIDFYKAFVTSNAWINHAGASDYAILDAETNLWCGSYHGGETRLSARITWGTETTYNQVKHFTTAGKTTLRDKASVPVGWYVLPSFKIQQLTNINNKGKMLSVFDFDTDGTMQMSFSFYEGAIKAKTFYTCLATTHPSFTSLRYPLYQDLPSAPTPLYILPNEGHVIQSNFAKNMSLGHRFSKFDTAYIVNPLQKHGWIYNHATYYKKLYYGFVEGYDAGLLINSLQFKKALDFIND